MVNIHINDLANSETELEELDLLADSEGYLKELANLETDKVCGGGWFDNLISRRSREKTPYLPSRPYEPEP